MIIFNLTPLRDAITVALYSRAKNLIQNHKNPITKLNIDGAKLSTPCGSEDEKSRVEGALNTLQAVLSAERVERR